MKIYRYLSAWAIIFTLVFSSTLTAQDDLYFNPSTDEDFSYKKEKYSDEGISDDYVDSSFDEEDYYYEDDFYYARRIQRFNRSFGPSFGFYDPCYANNFYYDPFFSGPSVYVGFGNSFAVNPWGYSPWGNYYGYGNPYYNPWNSWNSPYGSPYGYNPYSPYAYNPYYSNNNSYGYSYYPDYNVQPANYGPRGTRGGISSGVIDSEGNGRVGTVRGGRGDVEGTNDGPVRGESTRPTGVITIGENGVVKDGRDVRNNTINTDGETETRPIKTTRPTSRPQEVEDSRDTRNNTTRGNSRNIKRDDTRSPRSNTRSKTNTTRDRSSNSRNYYNNDRNSSRGSSSSPRSSRSSKGPR